MWENFRTVLEMEGLCGKALQVWVSCFTAKAFTNAKI
jgi:hypothetical protein